MTFELFSCDPNVYYTLVHSKLCNNLTIQSSRLLTGNICAYVMLQVEGIIDELRQQIENHCKMFRLRADAPDDEPSDNTLNLMSKFTCKHSDGNRVFVLTVCLCSGCSFRFGGEIFQSVHAAGSMVHSTANHSRRCSCSQTVNRKNQQLSTAGRMRA